MANGFEPLVGIRVLVVDRDHESRRLFDVALRAAGAEVSTIASFDESFAAFEHVEPHVIVADLGRPDEVGGAALVEWIRRRSLEEGGEAPAIAVTAYARSQDRARALGAGFDQCLAKPVSPRELVTVVARLAGVDAFQW